MSTEPAGKPVNKIEVLKQAKDGLAVWDNIFEYAKTGFAGITSDDLVRMRWFGIYQQKPNEDGFFFVRIRIPNGFLTPVQLREIAAITQEHARGFGDITTRQNIQLHWLTITTLADVITRLERVGLITKFACGDTPRNIVGCPLAGVLADEILDARPTVQAVDKAFIEADSELSNLPRKFKSAIAGCNVHCHQPQINDLGAYGVLRKHPVTGREERGFGLCVGGGLSSTPHMAQSLRVFVTPEQMPAVSLGIARVFRDHGYREKRTRARLKFLIADWGWEKFRDVLEKQIGFTLTHDDTLTGPPVAPHTDHMGIGQQKQTGFSYVGVPVERGRITAQQMADAAALAEEFAAPGQGQIVLSNKQNLIFLNIPHARVDALVKRLEAVGLSPHAPLWRTNLVSCTGTQFCNLAIVETKQRAANILKYLEDEVQVDSPIMVSVTGCPNSCAQYQIADIGLMGVVCNFRGQRGTEAFNILLGGALGHDAHFGKLTLKKVPADYVHLAIGNLAKAYMSERVDEEELFSSFISRNPPEKLAQWLTIPEMAEVV